MSFARAVSKELTKTMLSGGGFGDKTMSHLKVLEATPGLVTFIESKCISGIAGMFKKSGLTIY